MLGEFIRDELDRHRREALKAAAARIAELEVQLSSMREERDLAVTVAEGCRVLMERPVTEDDIQAAIAEARRIRPEIEAENAIRKALES